MSAILSTAASLCIKPTKTPLALYIYWPKHLMVASIQRILLHAAAYHKSSTVLFLRFQLSSVFSNFNFEFVSSLFDSSDEDHSFKFVPVVAVFLCDAPNTKQIISCQPFM